MKDDLRFVDSDMHVMEPPDLFERYLDPAFRDRVILPRPAPPSVRLVILVGAESPGEWPAGSGRGRGRSAPPTPPDMRARIRRFVKPSD